MSERRTRPTSVLGLRTALVVGALTLVVAACGAAASPSPSPSPSATPSPAPTASPTPTEAPPTQPGSQEVTPSSAPRTTGEAEVITVFTHCGFEGRLDWAGAFWRESGRTPEGAAIGDPEDTGRITLLSPTEAVFESSTGTLVTLERVDGPVLLQPCD